MSQSMTISALKPYFAFPFQDSGWKKRFLVGSLLVFASTFIPIIPLVFVFGYIVQVMRQAIEGENLALPGWDDLGKLGADGLKCSVVSLAFLLPGSIVLFGGMALYMLASFGVPLLMELGYGGAFSEGPFFLLFMSGMFILFISMVLGTLLYYAGVVPLPVAMAHFVAKDQLGAAFRIREWWKLLWRNKLSYFITWIIVGGLMAALYLIMMLLYSTMVLCLFIPLLSAPVIFYLMLVWAALFGQTYRESVVMVENGPDQAVAEVDGSQ